MMVSSLINCLMRLWARFIRNVYKDESYLTHTLPVEKKTIYASKVITALISIFTTVVVAVACLFICYYSEANMQALKSMLELHSPSDKLITNPAECDIPCPPGISLLVHIALINILQSL